MIDERRGGAENFRPSRSIFGYPPPKKPERSVLPIPFLLPFLSFAMRIGFGFDIHRLVPDRRLILCGVPFHHPLGLLGHSDADVAPHALCDALLGAAALGDIGHLFPDTDPAWKDADSIRLLQIVAQRVHAAGYRIENADVTILAESPKIAPFVSAMRERLATAMEIPVQAVSVKATTMEKLGPIGAKEGIAAQAVALLAESC